jgi:SAM-dependent methyltransferase
MTLLDLIHERVISDRRLTVLTKRIGTLLPERGHVLDVGTGRGALAERLAAAHDGLRLSGVDVLVQPGARIPVTLYDGLTLPFERDAFSAVLMCDVVHHAADQRQLLREAHRVAPMLVIKDHLAEGMFAQRRLTFMDHVGNDRFGVEVRANYWRRREWHEQFATCGWRIDFWSESLGLYPFPLNILFEGSLHFVARLCRAGDRC